MEKLITFAIVIVLIATCVLIGMIVRGQIETKRRRRNKTKIKQLNFANYMKGVGHGYILSKEGKEGENNWQNMQ